MNENDRFAAIGALVLVLGLALLVFSYVSKNNQESTGYMVTARFNHAEGIGVGSMIELAGMPVGRVAGQSLDEHFRAVLLLRFKSDVEIPKDSAAMIHSDGLIGGKFISIQPGGDEENLQDGGRFSYTQDSINLAQMLELVINQGKAKRGLAGEQPSSPSP